MPLWLNISPVLYYGPEQPDLRALINNHSLSHELGSESVTKYLRLYCWFCWTLVSSGLFCYTWTINHPKTQGFGGGIHVRLIKRDGRGGVGRVRQSVCRWCQHPHQQRRSRHWHPIPSVSQQDEQVLSMTTAKWQLWNANCQIITVTNRLSNVTCALWTIKWSWQMSSDKCQL